ncbi:MAG: EcsC family protein [Rhodocyclaceae bacterium]|nr:EcsC family protein [Rhodocyclaceae bacterium]
MFKEIQMPVALLARVMHRVLALHIGMAEPAPRHKIHAYRQNTLSLVEANRLNEPGLGYSECYFKQTVVRHRAVVSKAECRILPHSALDQRMCSKAVSRVRFAGQSPPLTPPSNTKPGNSTHPIFKRGKIGLCYGYKLTDEVGKQMVLSILAASGANTMEEKLAALLTLQQLKIILMKQTWKGMERAAENFLAKEGAIIAIRSLAKQLGVNLTKRKALQAIPAIGAVVGSSVNGWYIKEVGWAARRIFQDRWLTDNGKIIDE